MSKIRTLIVEDQALNARLFEMILASSEQFVHAGTVKNATLAPVHCARGDVDLVLMDVYTELGSDGLTAAEIIKQEYPQIKIIVVTGIPEVSYISRARAAGVESFWYKEATDTELIDVMIRTMEGESIYPSETPLIRLGDVDSHDLTKKELEVLRLIVQGDTNVEIAEHLTLSVETVKVHVKSLLSKTGFRTRTELAVRARESGLVIPRSEQ